MANSNLQDRTTPPKGYVPTDPTGPLQLPTGEPVPRYPIATPPSQGYGPNPIFKSPLPALMGLPDQQRNWYGRGMNLKGFWPATNGTPTAFAVAESASSNAFSLSGTVTTPAGSPPTTTAVVQFSKGFLSLPVVTVTPSTDAGTYYISSLTTQGFIVTYTNGGAQTFNWAAVGS